MFAYEGLFCLVCVQEPYVSEQLYWPGVPHMPDFLIATGKVSLVVPPGTSAAGPMAAALAAVPQLVIPIKAVLDGRCAAVIDDQRSVNESLKQAEGVVGGIAANPVAKFGSTAAW